MIGSSIKLVARRPSKTDHTSKNITKDKSISDFTLDRGGGSSYRGYDRRSAQFAARQMKAELLLGRWRKMSLLLHVKRSRIYTCLLFLLAAAHEKILLLLACALNPISNWN